MSKLKQLVGLTAIYGISSVVGRFLNYLLVPLYTYNLPTGEFGIVTELYAYVSFLIIILTYGMETGFFRFSESEKDSDKVYSTTLISLLFTSVLFVIFVTGFYKNVANFIGYPQNPEYVLWFGIIIALDAFVSIPFARLRQQNKAKRFATIKMLNIFTNIGLNLFFIVLCPYLIEHNSDSWALTFHDGSISVKYIFFSNLVASALTVILLLPDIFKVKLSFDKELLKRILIYSSPLLIAGLAGVVNETLDRILLKNFLPDTVDVMSEVGIYGASYKIAILMLLFIQMFRYAAEPFFFSQAKEKDSKQTYALVMKYFVIFGLFIFLFVMMYLDILKYFIGPEYHSGLKIVPIVLMANLFLGIIYNLSIWYKLTNKTKQGAYIAIFGATITIALNIILIPIIGYEGSAWATFVCYFSMMILSYFLGQKYFKVNYDIKTISMYLGIALILYFLSLYINLESKTLGLIVNTLLLITFGSIVFVKEKVFQLIKKRN